MKQGTIKRTWWLHIVAFSCVFTCLLMLWAPDAMAQDADDSRLITSGIGKGQAAAQRTLSEIQTLTTLEAQQEARISGQQATLAGERETSTPPPPTSTKLKPISPPLIQTFKRLRVIFRRLASMHAPPLIQPVTTPLNSLGTAQLGAVAPRLTPVLVFTPKQHASHLIVTLARKN